MGGSASYSYVWVVAHDLAVFARAGLALVGIHDKIFRASESKPQCNGNERGVEPAVVGLLHEAPLQARRETWSDDEYIVFVFES